MPTRNLDAVFFVETPPRIEFCDGVFKVSYAIGASASFEVVMSPRTYIEARLSGAAACAQWQLGTLPDDDKIAVIGRRKH